MRSKNKNRRIFLFLLSSCLQILFKDVSAQDTAILNIRARFADANAIYLLKTYEYIITIEKDQLKGVCNIHQQKIINKETGINHNAKEISVDSFIEAKDIKAATLIPKNNKYIKKPVEKIDLQADISGSSFYDDQKAYKFVYPSVQVGAILDLSYQLNYKELRFMGGHYFSDYIPIAENELVIRVRNNIHIGYKMFNCDGSGIKFTKEVGKKETIYKWTLKNANSLLQYNDAPDFRYYEPHILFYIEDYEINGTTTKLLGTTKDLYAWYCSLLKNLNVTEDRHLKKITDSLVVGMSDEKEKVKKIFYWVQDNISYVAFEDGLGGFVPRDAGLVCNRKFGDCKDMASIICEMLHFAGIKAYHTWIGTRDIPYNYTEIATPSIDNHMIASYQDTEGVWNFLDATGKKASMELFTSMIQGKQALVGVSCDSFLIVQVPIKDSSINQTVDSLSIEIKDRSVIGKGKVRMTGYDGLHYLYRTDRLSKDDYQDYFKRYFAKGNNKIYFDDVVKPVGDRGDVNLTYDIKLDDYARISQNELYINLNMNNKSSAATLPESRKVPLSSTYQSRNTLVTTLSIPEGYKPNFIPNNENYGNKIIGFSSEYVLANDKIIHTFIFYSSFLLLPVSDFGLYNTVLTQQIKVNKQVVSLIKK